MSREHDDAHRPGSVPLDPAQALRKLAQEAVELAVGYNRSLIEASLDPLVTISPDGLITDVNRATELVTGCTREQLIGTEFAGYFTDPDRARAGYRKVFEEGHVRDYALDIRGLDGTAVPVLYNASVYRDATGAVIGVFAAARDITERLRAEEALRQSEVRFSSAFEHAPIGLALVGPDGRWLKVNRALSAILGYSPDELLAKTFQDLTHPDDLDLDLDFVGQVLRDEIRTYQMEKRYFHRDGHVVWARLSVSLVRDAAGRPLHFISQIEDVTERKQSEEALRIASAYNRSLIEASLDPLVTIGPDGRITDVNRATEDVTGLARAQLVGTEFADYFTEPERARAGYRRVFQDGRVRDYELHLRHRDGHATPVLYNATVYRDADGKVIGVFAAARDMTERRRVIEQLRQLEKAESLGRMAGAVAHNLNNELQAVLGNLWLVSAELAPGSAAAESAAEAKRALLSAAELGTKLLAYLGQLPGKHEPTDLSHACRIAIQAMRAGGHPAVGLRADLPTPGPVISANQQEVHQILVNLVTNAYEAIGHAGGGVTVTVTSVSQADVPAQSRFPVGWEPDRAMYACLAVADTGVGIAGEDIGKLFDPFFTTKFTGRGLGLPVVLGIARAQGGGVTVASAPGQGSVFRVFLPVAP